MTRYNLSMAKNEEQMQQLIRLIETPEAISSIQPTPRLPLVKCRIDSFRLRGTGSMCHMLLLNVEFSNACRFRVFQCHFSTVSRFSFPRFQIPKCWHGRTEYWKLPAFLPNIQNVVTNFFMLTMSLYAFRAYFGYFISSYYSTRCWNLSPYHPLY